MAIESHEDRLVTLMRKANRELQDKGLDQSIKFYQDAKEEMHLVIGVPEELKHNAVYRVKVSSHYPNPIEHPKDLFPFAILETFTFGKYPLRVDSREIDHKEDLSLLSMACQLKNRLGQRYSHVPVFSDPFTTTASYIGSTVSGITYEHFNATSILASHTRLARNAELVLEALTEMVPKVL
jgi:hypothetical protein